MGWRAKVCCCMLSRLARATVARGGLKRGNVWCVVVKTWFMSPDFIFISTIKWSGSVVPLQVYTVALYRPENPWKEALSTPAPPSHWSSGGEESSAWDGRGVGSQNCWWEGKQELEKEKQEEEEEEEED